MHGDGRPVGVTMTTDRANPVIDFVRRAVRLTADGTTDGDLLDEFVACRALGLAEGTLSSRLATARGRLARRLARGGVLPAAALAALTGDAGAVPPPLLSSTAALGARYATAVGPIPAPVLALTQGVLT